MRKNLRTAISFLAFISLFSLSISATAKNVILIIGDGMDDQQITAARNYLNGAKGKSLLDTMPIRSAVQVLTVEEDNPNKYLYAADSANSATSMSTGKVTSIGRIATSAKTDQDLTTIIELAQKAGLKTGIVTTSAVTDATPASFIAHISGRGCQSTEYMIDWDGPGALVVDCAQDTIAKGGKGSIAEQMANSEVDLILGGGLQFFEDQNEAKNKTLLQQAQNNSFSVAMNLDEAQNAPNGKKLLGLFATKHLPVKMRGEDGRIAEEPDFSLINNIHRYIGSVTLPETMKCEANPEYADTPPLKELTNLALKRLENDKGFFLIIESASIDKQSHVRSPCGSIGEFEQLIESTQAALDFADKNKGTLIMVTADHAQAAQIIPAQTLYADFGVPVSSPGKIALVETPEGSILAINYATNQFDSEEHTGANVPLFANKQVKGKNGKDLIKPYLHQTDIFNISKSYLGLE